MKSRRRVIVIAAATSVVVGIAAGFATAGDSGAGASRQATKLTPGSYKINTNLNTKLEVPRPKGTTSGTGTFKGTLKVVSATKAIPHLEAEVCPPDGTRARCARPPRRAREGRQGRRPAVRALPFGTRRDEVGHGCRGRRDDRRQGVRERPHEGEPQRRDPRHGEGEAAAGGGRQRQPVREHHRRGDAGTHRPGQGALEEVRLRGLPYIDRRRSSTGPTWKGLAGRKVRLTTGQVVRATDGYLINAIEQPDAEITEGYSSGIMSTAIGNIPLAQAKAIVAYIKSVK